MVKARLSRLPTAPTALSLAAVVILAACADSAGSGGSGTTPDGGPVCGTCAEVYTNGGIVCGPGTSTDAWRSLSLCACTATCGSACGGNFCLGMPSSGDCGACMLTSCAAQETHCAQN